MSENTKTEEVKQEGDFKIKKKKTPKNLGHLSSSDPVKVDLTKPEATGEIQPDVVKVEIPKGTQPGEVLRIKGLGIPYVGQKKRGDLLVEVNVKTPTNLSKKQIELLKEFERLEKKKPRNKVKDFFKRAMGG